MIFDTVSALEIPQLATELTTEELKQIRGGNTAKKQGSKYKNKKGKKKHPHHKENNGN